MEQADRSLEEPAHRRAPAGAANGPPSSADPSPRGALHPLVLSPGLSQAVRALARSEECTPFMILLAAFQLLLGRWNGQEDFAIGSPVANRTRGKTARTIGYFVNMLALRADLSANPTVRELLARVRDTSLEAFENQDIPLEVLIPSLGSQRDASRSPLFQVMFVLQNNALPKKHPLDLTLAPLDLDQGTGTSKFDLAWVRGHTGTLHRKRGVQHGPVRHQHDRALRGTIT